MVDVHGRPVHRLVLGFEDRQQVAGVAGVGLDSQPVIGRCSHGRTVAGRNNKWAGGIRRHWVSSTPGQVGSVVVAPAPTLTKSPLLIRPAASPINSSTPATLFDITTPTFSC